MHASLILEKHSSTVKKDCLSFYLLSNCFYILSLKIEENIFIQVTFLSVRIYKPEKFFLPRQLNSFICVQTPDLERHRTSEFVTKN